LKPVFIDTIGWAHLFLRTEPFHSLVVESVSHALQAGGSLVTSNYVLAELSALFLSPLRVSRPLRLKLLAQIRSTPWVEIVHVDAGLDSIAWDYLISRADKDFTLADCTSFVIMERYGLTTALTNDRHFEQAAFARLLRP